MYVPFSNFATVHDNQQDFLLEARKQFMLCMDRFIATTNSGTLPVADMGSLNLQFDITEGVARMILSDSEKFMGKKFTFRTTNDTLYSCKMLNAVEYEVTNLSEPENSFCYSVEDIQIALNNGSWVIVKYSI